MAVLLACRNMCMEYGDDIIFKNVNLSIKENEVVGIVGSNGSGKTTLINIICAQKKPLNGKVFFYKDNLKIGYMKQSADYNNDDEISKMSCGEKTKKALNEVLYGKNDVLVLDEPTNHLDYEGIEYIIKKINNFKGTVIIISHDRYFLDQCAENIIEIEDGSCHKYNGNYSFYRSVKQKEYEKKLKLYNEQEKYKEKINAKLKILKAGHQKLIENHDLKQ